MKEFLKRNIDTIAVVLWFCIVITIAMIFT